MSHKKSVKCWGILGLLILVLGGGYGFLWNKASNRAEELVQNYLKLAQRDPRMKVSYNDLSMGGFPFAVKATLDGLKWHGDIKDGKISIDFEKEITFQMKLWDWETLHASDKGGSFSLDVGRAPLLGVSLKAAWDKSEGQMSFDSDGEIQSAAGEIEGIKVGDEEEALIKKVKYGSKDQGLDEKDPAVRSLTFEVDVKTGKIMDREIEATLKGEYAVPEAWVKSLRKNLEISLENPDEVIAFLKAMYANSEVVDIRSLALKMDGATLSLQGTLSVDEKLQPLASWTFEVSGLKALKKGSPFSAILFMAPMMGFEISEEGGIKLSGTVQDQEVTINGQVMAQVPMIDWEAMVNLANTVVNGQVKLSHMVEQN
ncbi:MAG: DUF2125 domain-containing protein [bacterium]|nr:DUF2125 domain-containing protein [bacterium]